MTRGMFIAAVAIAVTMSGCSKVVVVEVPGGSTTTPPAPASTVAGTAEGNDVERARGPRQGAPQGGTGATNSSTAAPPDGTPSPSATATLKGEGVFYALPRTVVRVVVKADKTVTASAKYAQFAPIFAPGSTPPCGKIKDCAKLKGDPGETVKYSLQQGATFTTFGEPDPRRVYMVKFTGGGALDQSLSMAWNEAGLLSTASASVTNRTTDIVVSGVKLVTGLATKAAAGTPTAEGRPTKAACPEPAAADEWIIPILLPIETEPTSNPLVANYCDLPAKDRGPNDENSRDDYPSQATDADKRALGAAMHAYELRAWPLIRQRTTLLTSTSLSVLDPAAYLDKLNPIIDAELNALFVGSKSTATWELPFELRSLVPNTPVTILSLSRVAGVCIVDSLRTPDAKPMPDDFQDPAAACPPPPKQADQTPVTVSIDYYPGRAQQLFSRVQAGVTEESGDRSFRYILPAQVKAAVRMGDATYGTGVFSVAQLGHVVSLPAKRRSKTIQYDLAMIEATGGLKSFKLGTTGGLDAATIDALAGAGGTVLDARNQQLKEARDKREQAEAAGDELAVLTRQQTILKLKDEICELQKKYGLACSVQP